MTASSIGLSRLGQVKGAGDNRELFRRISTGEVLEAFDRKKVFSGNVKRRNIAKGKSALFKITGRKTAGYHVPGRSITNLLQDANSPNPSNQPSDRNQIEIFIDGLLIAPDTVDNMDDLFEDTEYRTDFMHQLGEALASDEDARAARIIAATALKTDQLLAKPQNQNRNGTVLTLSAGYATASPTARADELAYMIKQVLVKMAEKDVGDTAISQLRCAVPPQQYHDFYDGSKVINADFNMGAPNGSYSGGGFGRVSGIPVTWSNHVSQSAYVLQTQDRNADYATDMSKIEAIIWHPDCMGILSLLRPKLEYTTGDWNIEYQATLFNAKMAIGMGSLRREVAAVIRRP